MTNVRRASKRSVSSRYGSSSVAVEGPATPPASPGPGAAVAQSSGSMACPFASRRAKLMPKPTYASLIAMAIHSSPEKRLMLNEVYAFVNAHRSLVPTASQPNWKNSIRHNLSLRPCFKKLPRWTADGKKLSAYWVLDTKCLPSAAQATVAHLDTMGTIPFPDEFLCKDPAEHEASVIGPPEPSNKKRTTSQEAAAASSAQLTPNASDESAESDSESDADAESDGGGDGEHARSPPPKKRRRQTGPPPAYPQSLAAGSPQQPAAGLSFASAAAVARGMGAFSQLQREVGSGPYGGGPGATALHRGVASSLPWDGSHSHPYGTMYPGMPMPVHPASFLAFGQQQHMGAPPVAAYPLPVARLAGRGGGAGGAGGSPAVKRESEAGMALLALAAAAVA